MHFYIPFVPKTCSAWNNLLDSITHANTLFVLKSSLSNYNLLVIIILCVVVFVDSQIIEFIDCEFIGNQDTPISIPNSNFTVLLC